MDGAACVSNRASANLDALFAPVEKGFGLFIWRWSRASAWLFCCERTVAPTRRATELGADRLTLTRRGTGGRLDIGASRLDPRGHRAR